MNYNTGGGPPSLLGAVLAAIVGCGLEEVRGRLPYENNYYLYRPILYLPLISDTDSRSQKRSGCLNYDTLTLC